MINSNGSFQLAIGPGKVIAIDCISAGEESAVLLYDGIDDSGSMLDMFFTDNIGSKAYANLRFNNGLFAVLRGKNPAQINIRLA